jgi:hypothetical protein
MSLLIDLRYLAQIAPRLSLFKKKSESLYNFRCVFCGDSQKNKHKTRGYVYQSKDHLSFKCHNCNLSCSLDNLISFIDPSIHKAYRLDKFRDKGVAGHTPFLIPKEDEQKASVGIDLKLPCLEDLPSDNLAVQYAKLRMLPRDRWSSLYYCENMKSLEYLNPAYEGRLPEEARMIIPFHDKNGNITGITGRAITPSKLRYVTMRISESPLVYGLDRVDVNRKIYITEGQIDSMFVENAIAPGGTDFERAIRFIPRENIVLVFDNQPRNKQVVHKIEGMIVKNYDIVIWPKDWNYKDINDAVMNGLSTLEIMTVLANNTHSGLALKLAIRDWKRI